MSDIKTRKSHPVDVHVGKCIRHFRWMTSMTQQQLAEKVGIKFQQIQKYETGANRVSASRLFEISEALGQPLSEFFPDEGEKDGPRADLNHQEAMIINAYRAAPHELKNVMLATAAVPAEAVA